jgi:hypothetical protein
MLAVVFQTRIRETGSASVASVAATTVAAIHVRRRSIVARCFARGEPVVDVPPMIGCHFARIDARCFDGIDEPENLHDLGPALDAEQHLAAGIDLHDGRNGFARLDGAHDVER